MTERVNPFLDRIRGGQPTLMMSIRSARTCDAVRIAHATGYHSIMIDLEHSAISLDTAAMLCGTANDLGMTPFIRTPERDYGVLGRLLDGGAAGIIAPRIETVAEAAAIARACRFPPRGQRSQLQTMPQYGYRLMPARTLNPLLDDATIVQIMLETPAGIANADAIAALDGVDLLTIGINDLCAELGCLGQFEDPRLRDALKTAANACRAHGKLLMAGGVGDLSIMSGLMNLGIAPLYICGTDTDMLFAGAEARAKRFLDWHATLTL